MRKLALSTIVAFAFYMGAAVAQSNMGGSAGAQGTQSASPNSGAQAGQPAPNENPGMTPSASTDQNSSSNMGESNKGEKKIKGCVQSQNGQYVLETKKGSVLLAGQDVSAHVGHEVTVKGTWENNSSANAGSSTASSSGSSEAWSKGTFNVTDVKMDSKTCKIKGNENSNTSGSSTSMPGAPTTGTTTPNSGTPNSNTATPPPQQ